MKDMKKMTDRQRKIIKRCRKKGVPVLVYRRKSNKNKLSVKKPVKRRKR